MLVTKQVAAFWHQHCSINPVIFIFFSTLFFNKVSELDVYIYISVCIQRTVSHNLHFCLCLL